DPDLPFFINRHRGEVEPRISYGFGRGGKAKRHDPRNVFAFPSFNPSELVEFGDLSADVDQQMRGVEPGDAFHSRLTGKHAAAEGFFADSIRADGAHSGDDDARKHKFSDVPRAASHERTSADANGFARCSLLAAQCS